MSLLAGLSTTVTPTRLGIRWLRPLPGLVRVPVFDPSYPDRAYVVVYEEKRRSYRVYAFLAATGDPLWETELPNGGYGAPLATGSLLVCLSRFTDVTALNSVTGEIVWTYSTANRIRSPLNQILTLTVFSSGGEILGLDPSGSLRFHARLPGHFFFGLCAEGPNRSILTFGVGSNNGKQILAVYSFDDGGELLWMHELGPGEIASSDTSGVWCEEGVAFVGGTESIAAIDARNGLVLWTIDSPLLSQRSMLTGDSSRVYATSVEGILIACDRRTGSLIWRKKISDDGLYMPATVAGDRLLIEADGMLQVIDSKSGTLLQEVPVGHAPYGCCAVHDDLLLFGGGDPPYFGLLCGVDLRSQSSMRCHFEKEYFAPVMGETLHAALTVDGCGTSIVAAELDLSSLGGKPQSKPFGRFGDTFLFSWQAQPGRNWGFYAIPVRIETSAAVAFSTARLVLFEADGLPPRILLKSIRLRKQERPDYSGAACLQAIRALSGDEVEQADMRDMVDAILAHAPGYSPFQIWRIVARRALQTQASKANELPEFR
jgi:outer membrane protein assembly factor BamB